MPQNLLYIPLTFYYPFLGIRWQKNQKKQVEFCLTYFISSIFSETKTKEVLCCVNVITITAAITSATITLHL